MSLDYHKVKTKDKGSGESSLGFFADIFALMSFVFLFMFIVSNFSLTLEKVGSNLKAKQLSGEYKENLDIVVKDYENKLRAYQLKKDAYLNDNPKEMEYYQKIQNKLYALDEQQQKKIDHQNEILKQMMQKQQDINSFNNLMKDIIDSKMVAAQNVIEVEKESKLQNEKRKKAEYLLQDYKSKYKNKLNQEMLDKKIALEQKYQKKIDAETELMRKEHIDRIYREVNSLEKESDSQKSGLKAEFERLSKNMQESKKKLIAKCDDRIKREVDEEKKKRLDDIRFMRKKYNESKGEWKKQCKTIIKREREDHNNEKSEIENQYERRLAMKDDVYEGQEIDPTSKKSKKDRRALLDRSVISDRAMKLMAKKLNHRFEKEKLPAQYDETNGEVHVEFPGIYFEINDYKLKRNMKDTLKRVVPVFAEAFFGDEKIRDRVASIEILGFASPVYKSKYVKTDIKKSEGREAVNYNMDLSLWRAQSVYRYIFNPDQLRYKYQADMLKYTKVAGRSYMRARMRRIRESRKGEICEQYDCEEWQKIIIKVNFKE